ncbi:hypothetical protein [Kitasatospora xanthocidica]|uniref:hypothetical protein n=1 Tax=Kitasatospora xanthocidica TaxID=83382 RepID=UPI001679D2B7|nr:hypothetical protein [Kitasatospora xanthocidica]
MNRDDPAFDADDMDALFRAVLDQQEPATPLALLPEVRRSGVRLRRRRRLLATGATAAAVGLLATAGWAVHGRTAAAPERTLPPAAGVRGAPAAPTSPPPAATTGPPPATTVATTAATAATGTGGTATTGGRALFALLQNHLPEDFREISAGTTTDDFLLTRHDGGTVQVSRRSDGPSGPFGGTTSPCELRTTDWGPMSPDGEDCVGMPLPDGSMVWVLHPLTFVPHGQESEIRVITPDRLVYALHFARAEAQPEPSDQTVALPQLLMLAGRSGFLAALRDGLGDSPAPGSSTPRPPSATP